MKSLRIYALLAAMVMLLTACGAKAEQPQEESAPPAIQQEVLPEAEPLSPLEETAALLQNATPSPTVNHVGGEWLILGLARSDLEVDPAYYEQYYKNVEDYLTQCGGVLHERKYSEYSRVILALTAIGKDPTNVAGYDLTKPLSNFDQTCFQGINGPMFALIALDSHGYDLPTADEGITQATKDMYIGLLLEKQLENGGWCLTGDQMETDMTAMALQALSNHCDREDVAQAVERGVEALVQAMNADGSFATNDGSSSESVSQVIVALSELGISLNDERFVRDGRTLMDRLMDYRMADGGFCHLIGEETNQMATEQAFYAMVAVQRLEEGKSALYDMNEAE